MGEFVESLGFRAGNVVGMKLFCPYSCVAQATFGIHHFKHLCSFEERVQNSVVDTPHLLIGGLS